MKQQAVTAVDGSKHETTEKLDLTALRRPAAVNSAAQPVTVAPQKSLGQRIKGLFSNLTKALEGDQEYHKYLGG